MKLYLYKRKKSRWMTLYKQILSKSEDFDKSEMALQNHLDDYHANRHNNENLSEDNMLLVFLEEKPAQRWLFRLAALLSIVWSLMVLVTETTLIFDFKLTGVY